MSGSNGFTWRGQRIEHARPAAARTAFAQLVSARQILDKDEGVLVPLVCDPLSVELPGELANR